MPDDAQKIADAQAWQIKVAPTYSDDQDQNNDNNK